MEASESHLTEPADVPVAPQTEDAAPDIAEGASLGAVVGGPEVAAAAERAAKADEGPPYLRVPYPIDRFDSGVSGVPVIESTKTSVSKAKVKQVKDAAKAAGVELIQES